MYFITFVKFEEYIFINERQNYVNKTVVFMK